MNLRLKFTLLLLGLILLFSAGISVYYRHEYAEVAELIASMKDQHQESVRRVIHLQSTELSAFVVEYSQQTPTARACEAISLRRLADKDAEQSPVVVLQTLQIRNTITLALREFRGVDAVWVLDRQGRFICMAADKPLSFTAAPFDGKSAANGFSYGINKQGGISGFTASSLAAASTMNGTTNISLARPLFLSSSAGPVEIRATAIYQSSGRTRDQVVCGYMVVGRVWDDAYLQTLGRIVQAKIAIEPAGTDTDSEGEALSSTVTCREPLYDPDGYPVATVRASRQDILLSDKLDSMVFETSAAVVFAGVVLVSTGWCGYRWVSLPLQRLMHALRTGSLDGISTMRPAAHELSNEFEKLTRLMREFLQQRDELQQSRQRLALHVEQTPLGVIEWDTNYCITSWNPAAERIFGYSSSEVFGRDGEPIGADTLAQMAQMAQTGSARTIRENTTKDGRLIFCEWYNTPLIDQGGVVVGGAALVRDVTEQRRVEVQLGHIMNSAQCLLWSAEVTDKSIIDDPTLPQSHSDLVWDFLYFDEAAAQRLIPMQVPKGRMYSDVSYERRHPDDVARTNRHGEEMLRQGKSYSQQFRVQELSGSWRWLREDVYVETLAPGRWRTVGVCIDITEVREAAEALQRQREFLRSVIDTDPNLIFVKDKDGVYSLANRAIAEVYGTTVEDLVGKRDADFISDPEIVAGYREADTKTLTALDDTFVAEEPIPLLDGSVRWLQTVKRPIHSPDGNGYQVLGICTDITERKHLESQLIHSGKLAALGELVAGVAHEINNPLSVISGHAQLLMLHADPAVREDGATVQEMVQRMARLVRSLRSYARSCGESESARRPEDLNQVVQSALDVIGGRLRSADVQVDLDLAEDMPPIAINEGEMEQVLVNLLSNAEYALRDMPTGQRRIAIRTREAPAPSPLRTSESCLLIVEDTGCGMPPTIRERIFDPFFSTKDIGDGTGLGLYLSHGIITAHGGTIRVSSRPNQGTTFTIELPRLPLDADLNPEVPLKI